MGRPIGLSRLEHPGMSQPPQPTLLDLEEKRLYSKPLLNDQALLFCEPLFVWPVALGDPTMGI